MNPNEMKTVSEKTSSSSITSFKSEKDRLYTLQGFLNKINKSDGNSFGNYFVDFSEMFPDNTEYQRYN